jgi:cytochrome b561
MDVNMTRTPRNPKKDNIKMTRFILYFFLLAMIFFAYLMSQNIIKSISGNIKSINWIQMDATLLNASIKITQGSTSSSNRTRHNYYAPQISYKYNFNGVACIGSKVAWVEGGDDGPLKELAYNFKYHFKHKIPIKVYVNPDKPCESVVDRAIHWSKLTSMGIILIIVILFASGIVYLLVKTSKR